MSWRVINRHRVLLPIHRHHLTNPCRSPSSTTLADDNLSSDFQFVPSASGRVSDEGIMQLASFLERYKKLFVVTGAGISTESGIRDYRSDGVGLYSVSKDRPISHQEFVKSPAARQRYWARNYVGWPMFSSFKPNLSHLCLKKLEQLGFVKWLVTQNVDRLHTKAGSENITELHGASSRVKCLECQSEICRHELQTRLDIVNPEFSSRIIAQTPDGDVSLPNEDVLSFQMVDCSSCGGPLKPDVVFFGDNVAQDTKEFLYRKLKCSSGLLVVGSSLQVYSSYRFALAASQRNIPIAILNIGPTRADHLATLRLSGVCSDVLARTIAVINK